MAAVTAGRAAGDGPPGGPARYRIEHRRPCRTTVLAVLTTAKLHLRDLDPFLSRLLLEGKTGWVVLVDEATGEAVLRRRVKPPGTRYRPPRRGTPAAGDPAGEGSPPALLKPGRRSR